jgi:hypothetical protein
MIKAIPDQGRQVSPNQTAEPLIPAKLLSIVSEFYAVLGTSSRTEVSQTGTSETSHTAQVALSGRTVTVTRGRRYPKQYAGTFTVTDSTVDLSGTLPLTAH